MHRLCLLCLLSACSDVTDPDGHDENELITEVVLSFVPRGGGDALTFSWADPEGDGDPVVDDVLLSDADDYDLSIAFLNGLEDPPEDLTPEIADEGDEHQVFLTGTAVEGPATGANPDAVVTHAYADTDVNGDPIGLVNTLVTDAEGSGSLVVTLRHLPPQSGTPVKRPDLAEQAAADGLDSLPGDVDVDVAFSLTVEQAE